jgi:Tfp pilus assembly protein PilX
MRQKKGKTAFVVVAIAVLAALLAFAAIRSLGTG